MGSRAGKRHHTSSRGGSSSIRVAVSSAFNAEHVDAVATTAQSSDAAAAAGAAVATTVSAAAAEPAVPASFTLEDAAALIAGGTSQSLEPNVVKRFLCIRIGESIQIIAVMYTDANAFALGKPLRGGSVEGFPDITALKNLLHPCMYVSKGTKGQYPVFMTEGSYILVATKRALEEELRSNLEIPSAIVSLSEEIDAGIQGKCYY